MSEKPTLWKTPEGRKVGCKRYEARSCGRSSPDTLASWTCDARFKKHCAREGSAQWAILANRATQQCRLIFLPKGKIQLAQASSEPRTSASRAKRAAVAPHWFCIGALTMGRTALTISGSALRIWGRALSPWAWLLTMWRRALSMLGRAFTMSGERSPYRASPEPFGMILARMRTSADHMRIVLNYGKSSTTSGKLWFCKELPRPYDNPWPCVGEPWQYGVSLDNIKRDQNKWKRSCLKIH